jgi:hypothetical protein
VRQESDTPLPVRLVGEGLLAAGFLLLTALPLVDFLGRQLAGFHIRGSATYSQQLTFFLTLALADLAPP